MSPRRRRARLAAPAAALAVIALVSGCTGSAGSAPEPATSPTASASSPSASSTEGPVTLRFAVYGDPQVVASYRAQARAFTQKHPNVTIKVETVSDQAAAQERLDRQFQSGTAPDLFLTDAGAVPALASAARVQPVDEMLEKRGISFGDKYERLGLEAFAANSALQCMPTDVSPAVVFYNKRLLRPADLVEPGQQPPTPQTGWKWPDFVKAAQQMSGDGVKGVYLAPELTTLTPLLRSAGADIVDDEVTPTTLALSDGGSRSALEEILAVARNPRITPTPASWHRRDALTRFENGRLGMIIGTRALVPVLRNQPGLDFNVYPLPSLGRLGDGRRRLRLLRVPDVQAHRRRRGLPGLRQQRRGVRDHRGVRWRGPGQPGHPALAGLRAEGPSAEEHRRVRQRDAPRRHDAEPAGLARRGQPDPAAARPAVLRPGPRPRRAAAPDRQAVLGADGGAHALA